MAGFSADGRATTSQAVTLIENDLQVPVDPATKFVVADGSDDTWAKLRFSSWDEAGAMLPRLPEAVTRTVIYNAIRDGVRSADLAPADALTILLDALAAEPEELIVAALLEWAVSELTDVYFPAATRAGHRARLAELAADLLERAPAGSDAQLTAARGFIRASADAELLGRWRAGTQLPDGLVLDLELRWSLLRRLSALGRLSEADIDAELVADASAAGVVHAAGARAIRPDPAAKERAWRALTEPGTLSAYELYAIAGAFFEPSQAELVAPYLPRFFPELAATVNFRSGWALGKLAGHAYPVSLASPELVAMADVALAGSAGRLDEGVRRAFLDRSDVVRRAVRSQQRYGG